MFTKKNLQKILAYFKIKFNIFLQQPSKRVKGMKDLFMFFAQVGHIYPAQIAFIPMALINLIENNYSVINQEIRLGIVEALSLMRKKKSIRTSKASNRRSPPIFF